MILTFTEVIASRKTASDKWTPTKAKATDGKTYVLAKSVVPQVENALGTALDCVTSSKSREYNGKEYTDFTVESAKHVAATAPVSAPTTTSTPTPQAVGSDRPAASPQLDRERLIVKQSAIKAAVELVVADKVPSANLWAVAEEIVSWVFEAGAPKNNGPRSVAQQHLEDIREKSADLPKYADEDAVCPGCGSKEHLIHTDQHGWFCSRKTGGCGHPPRGERLDAPISYGEWRAKTATTSVPWK
jgi:hypothetical protein